MTTHTVPGIALRRLVIGLLASVAWLMPGQSAFAQATGANGADLKPSAGGLGLRLEPELLPVVPADFDDQAPIFLEADRIEGVQGQRLEALGEVVARRRGQLLQSDRLTYSFTENAVTASGNVRFRRMGDVLTGDYAYYDLDTEAGVINAPTYSFRRVPEPTASPLSLPGQTASMSGPTQARGEARRLQIRDRDRYRAERATYTNCDVGDDDWHLQVSSLDLDRLKDVGIARNATVYFKGVPIL